MEHSGNTVGEILRKTREQKGYSIAQVHSATKMSPEVIRALEDDDLDSFAGEIYLKGFLRNYAAHLGLDGNRLWGMMKGRPGDMSPSGGDDAYWEIEESLRVEKLRSPQIFRRFVLPALLIVIVVLTVLLVRETRKVKRLTTSVQTHHTQDGVIPRAREV